MADDRQELRNVNWGEVFGFTHVFKGFRMAIHLSKLLLALAAILVIFVLGWGMDLIWSVGGGYAAVNEVSAGFTCPGDFGRLKDQWQETQDEQSRRLRAGTYNASKTLAPFRDALAQVNTRAPREPEPPAAGETERRMRPVPEGAWLGAAFAEIWREEQDQQPERKVADDYKKEHWPEALSESSDDFADMVDTIEELLEEAYEEADDEIQDKISVLADRDKAREQLEQDHKAALQALTRLKQDFSAAKEAVRGRPIFESLSDYESACLGNAISAVVRGDISGGLDQYQRMRTPAATGQPAAIQQAALPDAATGGFVFWVLAAVHGMQWFIAEHAVYAVIFLVVALATWALFGGAVHRMAALHAAREEKISLSQALRFSASKFLSFFMAPLIPLLFVFVCGALLMLGGLFGNLMGFGAILVGALFFLAVVMGLIIAFLALGLVTGMSLMYPTIAVEGSDSFDAISRSFSYVFARPWRAGLYAVVALIYGVVCYLFVRFFAYLALAAAHFFVGVGVWAGGENVANTPDKLHIMWKSPTFAQFHLPSNWEAMSTCEAIGAFCISVWVYLIIGLVLAFALSYAASATTIVYYLLRRKVDATDLDDVYVEEAEEAFAAPPEAEAEAPAETAKGEPEAPEAEGEQEAEGGESPPEPEAEGEK